MELGRLERFQEEVLQHAEGNAALLAEAAALVQTGRAEEALDFYRRCHRDLQAFHDKWDAEIRSGDPSFIDWWRQWVAEEEAALLTNEGLALRWMGRVDEASAAFESALRSTAAEAPDHASLLHAIGGLRQQQQAFAEAEDLCRRAHAEFAALASNAAATDPDNAGHVWSQAALALADTAYAALGRGDHAGFENRFAEAIGFAEQHDLPDLADKLWLRQAGVLLGVDASGETAQRVDAERKRRCSRNADPEFQVEVLQLVAEYWRERGDLEQARRKLEEARPLAPAHRRWALLRQLADIAETQEDAQAALDYARDALATARQLGMPQAVAACLRALVSLHAASNPEEAERCLSELRGFGEMDEIKNALLSRVVVYCQQKRFELATRDLEEAEHATPGDPGVLLARVAVLRGLDAKEEALRATEKAAAAFREQIRQGGADWKSGLDSLAALHESGAFLAAELGRIEEAFVWAESGKALRLRSRFIAPTDESKRTEISFSALRERLRAESATLLFFCVTHRGTLALLCDPDVETPRAFFLDLTEKALADLLPTDRQSTHWNQGVYDALCPLSEKLAPCLGEAVGHKENGKLYVVPDAQLYFIPFAALGVEDGSKVIDHCAVTYLPCAAMLVSRPPAEAGSRTCLAAGAGRVDEFSFADQAAEIAALPWDAAECLAEARAQEFVDEMAHFNVLHLACHGQMEGRLPTTRSASILELADRRLSARDVYGLSLTAELVFLNACVSGRFQSRLSSEVGGFWEAFLHAGASGIIVTLAYVHPESAQRLALAFYRHWLNGKSAGEALRQAQLEARQERPEPCDWATHVLIGVG
jgi:CHAT domain